MPPGFILVGAGVGPMFVAIPVSAMNDVPPAGSGVASGIMTTGHELGAAVGVAVLTTVAGDPTTRARLVSGYGSAFFAVAVHLGALLVPIQQHRPHRSLRTKDAAASPQTIATQAAAHAR